MNNNKASLIFLIPVIVVLLGAGSNNIIRDGILVISINQSGDKEKVIIMNNIYNFKSGLVVVKKLFGKSAIKVVIVKYMDKIFTYEESNFTKEIEKISKKHGSKFVKNYLPSSYKVKRKK